MSFDTKPWIPTRRELEAAIAEALDRRALSLRWGGTGCLPAGSTDLERAQDVLKTWGVLDSGLLVPLARLPSIAAQGGVPAANVGAANGVAPLDSSADVPLANLPTIAAQGGVPAANVGAANGVAPLDSGSKVPNANLPAMGAASAGAAGTAGLAPGAAAGSHLRALRGDGTHSNELDIDKIFAAANLTDPVLRTATTGDGTDRWTVAARGSTTHNARLVTAGSVDAVVHPRIEGQGYGWLNERGDPVSKRRKASRRLVTKVGAAGFYALGVEAPTQYGTVTQEDTTRAFYQVYAYTDTTGSVAGLTLGALVERRWQFDVLFQVEVQLFTLSRFWLGLFNGDPSGSANPNTLHGFGVRYDATADSGSNHFRVWGCDGGGTSTVKIADGSVSPFNAFQPAVNVQLRFLLRNVPNTLGRFEAWAQSGADDTNASLEGTWYFLGFLDTANGDKVPTAATQLAPWVTITNINSAVASTHKLRVHAIDVVT